MAFSSFLPSTLEGSITSSGALMANAFGDRYAACEGGSVVGPVVLLPAHPASAPIMRRATATHALFMLEPGRARGKSVVTDFRRWLVVQERILMLHRFSNGGSPTTEALQGCGAHTAL